MLTFISTKISTPIGPNNKDAQVLYLSCLPMHLSNVISLIIVVVFGPRWTISFFPWMDKSPLITLFTKVPPLLLEMAHHDVLNVLSLHSYVTIQDLQLLIASILHP